MEMHLHELSRNEVERLAIVARKHQMARGRGEHAAAGKPEWKMGDHEVSCVQAMLAACDPHAP